MQLHPNVPGPLALREDRRPSLRITARSYSFTICRGGGGGGGGGGERELQIKYLPTLMVKKRENGKKIMIGINEIAASR